MTIKKTTLQNRRDAINWTAYVLQAVDKARKTKNIVFLDVGRTQTAFILQDALTTMALQGEEAAWNVEVRVHTLH
ncbi:hypothetical protein P105_gp19 [Pelagibacter phage HTVC105P]|nr:hypothetical protein P105_gp19 [Pelagibacter phage HTVC105P]